MKKLLVGILVVSILLLSSGIIFAAESIDSVQTDTDPIVTTSNWPGFSED